MSPSKIVSLLQQAVELHGVGQLAAAEKIYREVRLAAPKNFDVLHLSGLLAYQQGRATDAVELLTRAHRLDRKAAVCEMRLGLALLAVGQMAVAEEHFRGVLKREPKYAEGWDNLAYCLKLQDRLTEALEAHERAVTLDPKFVNGWYNYGLTYGVLGYPERSLPCFEQALALDPAFVPARFGRGQALHQLNQMPEAIAEYDRVVAAAPQLLEVRSCRLFALHHVDGYSREQLFAEHLAYARVLGERPAPMLPNLPDPNRRLRLAVLSTDLREHSCAYFLEPLLRHLDPADFEIYLYHDHFRTDAMSIRLQTLAAQWRNFAGQPEATVEQTVRTDAPDVLIDLAGHTGISNRLPLLARRLAPVQITYLGYPNTTGVPAIDYRFTDAVADPVPVADALATEKLVRFAPTAWAYLPPQDSPAPNVRPVDAPVAFGCFNTLAKLTEPMLRVWARILAAVPAARIVIKGGGLEVPQLRSYHEQRMQRAGLPLERVDFLARTARTADHLACYHQVDISLDTFPYHGTTTTCEALWMSVPVVTLAGDRHVSRVGASLLTAAGHPEWIATDTDEYVRIAVALASDVARRRELRASLRAELQRSVLMDHAGQSQRFGAALRDCWRRWCGQRAAAAA